MNITTTIKEYALKYLPECITALIVVALFGVYMTSFAAVNTRQPIVFQGRLTDTSYVPSPDGAYPMKFKIWDAASGGNCLWATGTNNNDTTGGAANCPTGGDLASPVTVSRGVFSVRLGDTSSGADNNPAINLDFNSGQYYLEITVGPISGSATDTLSPRVRIGGAPYSYNADLFDALDSNQFVRSDRVAANTTIAESTSYINPASAITDSALLGVAVGGTEKFRIDAEGDVDAAGKMRVGSITAPVAVLDVNGNVRTTGKATAVITGSIDPAASTAVVGVSTLFTKELVVGDRITVSGETRTITAITDDTNLTVDTAFTDNSNDTTVDALYALATFNTSTPTLGMVINDQGRVGLGVTAPSTNLDIAGLTINTDDDNTIAGQKVSGTFTKNDTNTRTFSVLKTVPTFNFGGSNTTTTVNVLDLDSINTSVTGLTTTNLIKASYGGAQKMVLDSGGNLTITGNMGIGTAGAAPSKLAIITSGEAESLSLRDDTQGDANNHIMWKNAIGASGTYLSHWLTGGNRDNSRPDYMGWIMDTAIEYSDAYSTITTPTNFKGWLWSVYNGGYADRMAITQAGNVGIGTIEPSSMLHVNGNAQLGTASSSTGQLKLYNASSANATTLQAGNASAAVTYTWPTAAPTQNGQVLTATTGGVLSWTTPSTVTAETFIPSSVRQGSGVVSTQMNSNTTGYVGAFYLPHTMTVNKLTIATGTVATSDAVKIGVYSENGQTKEIDITTVALTSDATFTTAVASVSLSAGVHYVVVVPVDTADVSIKTWDNELSALEYAVASEPKHSGTITVTASTLPTTFNPTTDITFSNTKTTVIRLDN